MDFASHLRHIVAPHAQRLIDSHFNNPAPRPQISIPANRMEDTDLIVTDGIKSAAKHLEALYGVCWSVANYGGEIDPALKKRAEEAVKAYNTKEEPGDG